MTDSDDGDSPTEEPPELPCVLPASDDPEQLDGANPLFFSELPDHIEQAKALCATCPVIDSCLALALAWPWPSMYVVGTGVWGGKTWQERAEIRRRASS